MISEPKSKETQNRNPRPQNPSEAQRKRVREERGEGRSGYEVFVERRKRNGESFFDEGQARKSARGMPWHQEPMKDVTSCDKPWGGANIRYIHGFPNGGTR